jgi:hypothetical protein
MWRKESASAIKAKTLRCPVNTKKVLSLVQLVFRIVKVLMEWTHASISALNVPGWYNHPTIVKQMGSLKMKISVVLPDNSYRRIFLTFYGRDVNPEILDLCCWRDSKHHVTIFNIGCVGVSSKSIVCLNRSFFTNAAYAFSVVLTEA